MHSIKFPERILFWSQKELLPTPQLEIYLLHSMWVNVCHYKKNEVSRISLYKMTRQANFTYFVSFISRKNCGILAGRGTTFSTMPSDKNLKLWPNHTLIRQFNYMPYLNSVFFIFSKGQLKPRLHFLNCINMQTNGIMFTSIARYWQQFPKILKLVSIKPH